QWRQFDLTYADARPFQVSIARCEQNLHTGLSQYLEELCQPRHFPMSAVAQGTSDRLNIVPYPQAIGSSQLFDQKPPALNRIKGQPLHSISPPPVREDRRCLFDQIG